MANRQSISEESARDEYILDTLRRAHTSEGERFIQEHLPATEFIALEYFGLALARVKGNKTQDEADDEALARVAKIIGSRTTTQMLFGGSFYRDSIVNDNEVQYYTLDPSEGVSGVFGDCKKCGADIYSVKVIQTRSADEGSTTFLTCLNCGNRTKS